ncbi:MAG: hypothetical protein RR340_08405 [Cloacibacillus sp.]
MSDKFIYDDPAMMSILVQQKQGAANNNRIFEPASKGDWQAKGIIALAIFVIAFLLAVLA